MKTATFIKVEEEPRMSKNLKVEDDPKLQKALTRKSTKRNGGLAKQATKRGLNKRNESEPLHDEELQIMENMIGGESSGIKSTIRAG